MPRPGVSREQVYAAAEALVAEGQSATVVAVRRRLGGGSPNTITPILADWRAERAPVATLPTAPATALRQVWTAAVQAALRHLETERGTDETEVLAREHQALLAEIDRLEGALVQSRTEARDARAVADERDRLLDAQRAEVLETHRQQVEALVRISRIEAEAEYARTEAERLRETLSAVTVERDTARLEIERLKVELAHALNALNTSARKIEKARAVAQEEHRARRAAERALAEHRGERP